MGLVGALVITRWSYGLLRDTSRILLDSEVDWETVEKVRSLIEADSDNLVADLHVWQISPQEVSVIVTVVTHFPKPADHYKKIISDFLGSAHITVEVQECDSEPCLTSKTIAG
jgi:Co/Zn/Cd efflux system component